jgi:hypothetical protein
MSRALHDQLMDIGCRNERIGNAVKVASRLLHEAGGAEIKPNLDAARIGEAWLLLELVSEVIAINGAALNAAEVVSMRPEGPAA